jgi:hypothetical protein
MVEKLLQLLIGEVDAELLEAVELSFFFYVRMHVRTGEQKQEGEKKAERRDKNHLSVKQELRENQSICYIEYLK